MTEETKRVLWEKLLDSKAWLLEDNLAGQIFLLALGKIIGNCFSFQLIMLCLGKILQVSQYTLQVHADLDSIKVLITQTCSCYISFQLVFSIMVSQVDNLTKILLESCKIL